MAALATRRGARALAEAFDGLARLPRPEREARLRAGWTRASTSPPRTTRLPVLLRETRALRIAANVLWAGLFVGLPALLWTPPGAAVPGVGAVTVVAWIIAAVLFERALRRSSWLGPGLRPDLTKRITAVASPLATIRAADHIARELCGDLDPLAVAAAVLPRRAAAARAVAALRPALPRPRDVPEGGDADARWMRAETLARVERALRASDIDPQSLLAPPRATTRWSPGAPSAWPSTGRERAADDVRQRTVPRDHAVCLRLVRRRHAIGAAKETRRGGLPPPARSWSARGLVGGERLWAPPSSKTQCEPH